MSERQMETTDDLELLLAILPPSIRQRVEGDADLHSLVEVVLDLGRIPEARFPGRTVDLADEPVSAEMLAHAVERVGAFGGDNRAGIGGTLHRISAIRNRQGDVIGLTCRVGRAVVGTVDIVRDVVETGRSILLLGRPGVGKTTLLREAARVLADELGKRVVVVDTSNEIAGDGDVPHPGIGRARRMQVPAPTAQHAVMIEAVENHMPEVIVIDEIGTAAEAQAARTIAERGVQLIATAHGNSLENLLRNPTLSDLVGGIQAVTLSDEEARRRGTQKTVLEREAPPTFDVLIEIHEQDLLAVHHRVADVVDLFLRGVPPRPELRRRTAGGEVEIERGAPQRRETAAPALEPEPEEAPPPRHSGLRPPPPGEPAPLGGELGRPLRIFPYAVSRGKLERAVRDLNVPARMVNTLSEADVVVTVKAQERRQPQRLRDAQMRGVRLAVARSNTVKQLERFLRAEFGLPDPAVEHQAALERVEAAIDEVINEGRPVELPPSPRHVRRMQHEAAVSAGLYTQSKGQEPFRRVVLYPS